MITRFATLTSRIAALFALSIALVACGGGGGGSTSNGFLDDNSDSTTTEELFQVSMTLVNASGEQTSSLTGTAPATLTVSVSNSQGRAVADALVEVASDLVSLSPASALTDSDGEATFTVTVDSTASGAGRITATVSNEASESVEEAINIQIDKEGLRLGYIADGTFIESTIGVVPESALVSGGTAELIVDIVDEDGNRVTSTESIIITSDCLASGDATISPSSPIETATGNVQVTYTADTCYDSDSITASLYGSSAGAFASLGIGSPQANSLNFVSADPELIVLAGTGGGTDRKETSTMTFEVLDSSGSALSGVPVSFSLSSTIGGLELLQTSAVSDGEGLVTTQVQSGDIPTSVRVIATISASDGSGTQLSTVSDILAVSTGLPDQNSISLSVSDTFVVDQGMNIDGLTREITVRMADKFNNPVPDGTVAVFTTEYGTIDPSCVTGTRNGDRASGTPDTGLCTVVWSSGNPRTPTLENNILRITDTAAYNCPSFAIFASGPCPDSFGVRTGGRSTILVTAIGEESFVDRNGDGIYNEAEAEADLFDNLPEAFLDNNEDGVFNPAVCSETSTSAACISGNEETFVDFNDNQQYDYNNDTIEDPNNPGDYIAAYNGLLCPEAGDGIWCSRELVNVRDSAVITLGAGGTGAGYYFQVTDGSSYANTVEGGSYTVEAGTNYAVFISDIFNNPPPGGSTITIEGSDGCQIDTLDSITIPNIYSSGAYGFTLQVTGDAADEDPTGSVDITLNPSGASLSQTITLGCSY